VRVAECSLAIKKISAEGKDRLRKAPEEKIPNKISIHRGKVVFGYGRRWVTEGRTDV